MTPAQREGLRLAQQRPTLREIVLTALGVLLIILVCSIMAQAKWKPEYASADPEIQKWFGEQHNGEGQSCCDPSDGHPFYGAYEIEPDGGVTIHDGGDVYRLPAYMILKGKNPTGHAVWWYVITVNGGHVDYCFAPGTLS